MVLARPLPTPTAAAPGSAAKIRVLAERVAAGEQLHHPHDNRRCATPNGLLRRRGDMAELPRVEIVCGDGTSLGGYRA